MSTPLLIVKADGTSEPFDPAKLQASLARSGATPEMVELIQKEIEKELYPGIATSEIYRHAFTHLREHKQGIAARYSLKRAVLDFGPSGFPFEAYIAELFRKEGSTAVIDQIVQGGCVEHEVDVVLEKQGKKTFVEAKFHNSAGFKTDLKTVLYVAARIEDIQKTLPNEKITGLVVTNTEFTSKAVQYATCWGLDLLGWNYPGSANLHDRIHKTKLYPVTALTTLSKREKIVLLEQKKVLCSDVSGDPSVLAGVGVRGAKARRVLEEVGALCVPGNDI